MPTEPPPAEAAQAEKEEPPEPGRRPSTELATEASPASGRIWQDIVTAGVSFLEKLGQALAAAGTAPHDAAGSASAASASIAQDARTGRPCLQLPLPDAETLRRISDVLAALAKGR